METEVLKRAKRVTNTDAYASLSPIEKEKFKMAAEHAKTIEELPKRFRNILKSAEREIQGY
jgi:hypothetical protein